MGSNHDVSVSSGRSGAQLALMHAEAQDALAKRVEGAVLRRRSAQDRAERAMRLTHGAMREVLEANDKYRAGMAQLWKETAKDRDRSDQARHIEASVRDRHAALSDDAALRLLNGDVRADAVGRNHLDIFGVPYANSWEHSDGAGAPHARQRTWANAGTGEIGFDYQIFPERGDLFCGAAVWVNFMRRAPGFPPGQGPPGRVQVRTYAPYSYRWLDQSGMEAAHSEAGFGVYVLSWDLHGGDRVVELDHYDDLIWNDTTDWNWARGNQSFPDTDSSVPLLFPQAPDFPIRPGRFYSAAIWCFGSGSAAGQLTEFHASLTRSELAARVVFVAVDQQ